ncbi:MAG: hypothetical protein HY699_19290 [Deltaproteobacteria bacterium]|nr:hypothetical protein [Deltaproteobacteria bacterium]
MSELQGSCENLGTFLGNIIHRVNAAMQETEAMFYGYRPYVPVAVRRQQAQREMAKLRKKGHPVSPVVIEGRTIATTFWGKAWCDNLELYSDYANRLPRGRTYVRNGSVVDLQIAAPCFASAHTYFSPTPTPWCRAAGAGTGWCWACSCCCSAAALLPFRVHVVRAKRPLDLYQVQNLHQRQ